MNEKTPDDFLARLGLGKKEDESIEGAVAAACLAGGGGQPGGETEQAEPATEKDPRGRKRKWFRIPMDRLDQATVDTLPPDILAEHGLSRGSPADDTEFREMVGAVKEIANEVASTLVFQIAIKRGHEKDYAKQVGELARMSPRVDSLIGSGAVGVCKKYAVRFEYVSETALIGGLLLWAFGIGAAVRAVPVLKKEEGGEP